MERPAVGPLFRQKELDTFGWRGKMALEDYRKGRDSEKMNEAGEKGGRFGGHEHHASHLHFDLRLEMDCVLKSWAIPKGPSMNPADRRLAVMVEDHPLSYISFRGEIVEGSYGAGKVEIWDSGTYDIRDNELEDGKLIFGLYGTKLKGLFTLIRLKKDPKHWLLIKLRDGFADPVWRLEQVLPGNSH
jgi:bifunctional non-homologous end joining protein LigD